MASFRQQALTEQGFEPLAVKVNQAAGGRHWALLSRGLTGDLSKRSSFDDLAEHLGTSGWSTLRFDYRGRGRSQATGNEPTTHSMLEDVAHAYSVLAEQLGRPPDAVIARGFGGRLTLDALRGQSAVPIVLWAPIIWLRTSLELRGRLHELRRTGRLIMDGTELAPGFLEALEDPSDEEIMRWIAPMRRHFIVQPEEDRVSPVRLADDLRSLIVAAGGSAELVLTPGAHPHPEEQVEPQIRAIVNVLSNLGNPPAGAS